MFDFLRKKSARNKPAALGQNEKKHIRCQYKNKKKCSDDCADCHFSIKLKGDFMMQVEAYDSAAELYEEAVAREPDYADAWAALGRASSLRGDHRRALEAYEEALDIDEVFGEALYGRAVALKDMGSLEEALDAADDVLYYYDYEPCRQLKKEIRGLQAEMTASEAKKLEEKNRLLMKMMHLAAQEGYIQERMPTVADVTAAADVLIPECFMHLTGRKKFTLEAVKSAAVCCFYGGAGLAALWKQRVRDFTVQGIEDNLFAPRGFPCMDEYACELLGVPFESQEGQALRKFSRELSNMALNAIMNQVGAVRMDNAQMEALVKDSMRDVYLVGAGIGLAWDTQFLR